MRPASAAVGRSASVPAVGDAAPRQLLSRDVVDRDPAPLPPPPSTLSARPRSAVAAAALTGSRTVSVRNAALALVGRSKVDVFVRLRPPVRADGGGPGCVTVAPDDGTVAVSDASRGTTETFGFDRVFAPGTDNAALFDAAVRGIVDQVATGLSCAVLSYGQTGSGKSHTIVGSGADPGVIPRAAAHLLACLSKAYPGQHSLRVSMLELYNENVQDLLAVPDAAGSAASGSGGGAASGGAAAQGADDHDSGSDASDGETAVSTPTSSAASSGKASAVKRSGTAVGGPAVSAHSGSSCDGSSATSSSLPPSDPLSDVSSSSGGSAACNPAVDDVTVAGAGVHRSAAVAAALQQAAAGAAPPAAHVARAVTGHGPLPAVPEERVLSFADAQVLLQVAGTGSGATAAAVARLGRPGLGSFDRPSRQGGSTSASSGDFSGGSDGTTKSTAAGVGGAGLRLVDLPDHGTVALGATQVAVTRAEQVAWLLAHADAASSYACTRMNDASNRAHRLFTFAVAFRRGGGGVGGGGGGWYTSTLTLADLAGSEDVSRSGAAGAAAREASHINKSLLTLGRVVNALASGSAHIPYRESKLTRLLADALGGVCKTTFIACVGPAAASLSETLSTLRYARRASEAFNISQLPRWQQDDALIESLARRVQTLEADARAAAGAHARDVAALQAQLAAVAQQRDEAAAGLQAAAAQASGLRTELAAAVAARDAYRFQRGQLQATLAGARRTRDVLLAAHRRQEADQQAREAELAAQVAAARDDNRRLRAAVDAKADAARANRAVATQFDGGVRDQLAATALRVTAFCDAQNGGHASLAAGLATMAADVDAGQQALRASLAAVTAACSEALGALRQQVNDALDAAITQAAAGAGSVASALTDCSAAVGDLHAQLEVRAAAAAGAAADTEARFTSRLTELRRRVGEWGADLGAFSAGLADGLTALQAQLDADAAAHAAAVTSCGDASATVAAAQQAALSAAGDRLLAELHQAATRLVREHVDAAAARSASDCAQLAAAHAAAAAGVRDTAAAAGAAVAALQTAVQDRTITDTVEVGASQEFLASTATELAASAAAVAQDADTSQSAVADVCGGLARHIRDAQAAAAASASALVQSLGAAAHTATSATSKAGDAVASGVTGVGDGAAAHAAATAAAVAHLQSTQQALQAGCAEHVDHAHAAAARLGDDVARLVGQELSFDVTPAPVDALPLAAPPPPLLPSLRAYSALVDAAAQVASSGGGGIDTRDPAAAAAAEAGQLRSAWAHEERVAAGDGAARDFDEDIRDVGATADGWRGSPSSSLLPATAADRRGMRNGSGPGGGSGGSGPSPVSDGRRRRR